MNMNINVGDEVTLVRSALCYMFNNETKKI